VVRKTIEISNHELMKRINRAKVLNAIRLNLSLSRSDIARLVGLDKKSITNFVSEIIAEGLVEEVGRKMVAKGRPLTLLDFSHDGPLVAGLDISAECVSGVLLDFRGEIYSSQSVPLGENAAAAVIAKAVKNVFASLEEVAKKRLYGTGLSVQGVIDLEQGLVIESINLPGLRGFNFRESFEKISDRKMYFEESSRAKALAEKWFGAGRQHDDFVCIDLGVGIGAGLVSDRRLYRGAGEYAGEIGHVVIERAGRECRCGNRGCLEAYLSERVLLEKIGGAATGARSLAEIGEVDSGARKVLEQAGSDLGEGLAVLVNVMNPTTIILNGNLMRFEDIVMPKVWEGLKRNSLAACLEGTEVIASTLPQAAALGAAAVVLSEVFELEGYYYI
jgi:predicted NBD/HSP70 family sugar kinase